MRFVLSRLNASKIRANIFYIQIIGKYYRNEWSINKK